MLFDTHVHLTEEDKDPAAYLQRALDAGVTEMLFCSSGMENSRRTADFAAASPAFRYAVGVHPHEAGTALEPASAYRVFNPDAIGELGLDYYYDFTPRERQIEVFQDFLELALELDKPAVVHCRDKDGAEQAYADAYAVLKPFAERGGRFELHSYAGSVDWMKKFRDLDAWFGVGGMLTFKRAENIRTVVAEMPLEKIMLETDSPYLAPVPHRGKTNHPSFLPHTAKALADLTGKMTEEICAITTANAHRWLGDDRA